ncbi:hypothetical protein ABPG75_001454 [Micractinium tetrahymenae]
MAGVQDNHARLLRFLRRKASQQDHKETSRAARDALEGVSTCLKARAADVEKVKGKLPGCQLLTHCPALLNAAASLGPEYLLEMPTFSEGLAARIGKGARQLVSTPSDEHAAKLGVSIYRGCAAFGHMPNMRGAVQFGILAAAATQVRLDCITAAAHLRGIRMSFGLEGPRTICMQPTGAAEDVLAQFAPLIDAKLRDACADAKPPRWSLELPPLMQLADAPSQGRTLWQLFLSSDPTVLSAFVEAVLKGALQGEELEAVVRDVLPLFGAFPARLAAAPEPGAP